MLMLMFSTSCSPVRLKLAHREFMKGGGEPGSEINYRPQKASGISKQLANAAKDNILSKTSEIREEKIFYGHCEPDRCEWLYSAGLTLTYHAQSN